MKKHNATCPKCGSDEATMFVGYMVNSRGEHPEFEWFCNACSHSFGNADLLDAVRSGKSSVVSHPERTSNEAQLLREADAIMAQMCDEWESTLQILDETPLEEMDATIKSIKHDDMRYIRKARAWLDKLGFPHD